VVRRAPDLCVLARVLRLHLSVDGGMSEFVLKGVKEICAIRDTVLLQYV
jgi:hypothetical protein